MYIKDLIKKIFNNGPIMALFGVLLGSLISGFFAFQTQNKLIAHQENIYKDNYRIEKNKELRKDIEEFIVDLSFIIHESDSLRIRNKLRNMISTSLKITLLNDYNIGRDCFELTESLNNTIQKGEIDDKHYEELIKKWLLSIKSEMKIVDYSIDDQALKRDVLKLLFNESILNSPTKTSEE